MLDFWMLFQLNSGQAEMKKPEEGLVNLTQLASIFELLLGTLWCVGTVDQSWCELK